MENFGRYLPTISKETQKDKKVVKQEKKKGCFVTRIENPVVPPANWFFFRGRKHDEF
jgi:hypothetical protein